jgi:hypothetical protein
MFAVLVYACKIPRLFSTKELASNHYTAHFLFLNLVFPFENSSTMCDPFNTSIEAALWEERNDLDPFIAEHYATNAQHELHRACDAHPRNFQHIRNVCRLVSYYNSIATSAQLPEDSDFEDGEVVDSGDAAFIHPDRAALIASGDDGTAALSSSSRSVSVSANHNNEVVAVADGPDHRSRESSVESIDREDVWDDSVRAQRHRHNRNHRVQRWAPQQQHRQQQISQQQQVPQQWNPQMFFHGPVVVNNYFAPQADFTAEARSFFSDPTSQHFHHFGSLPQHGPNEYQPQQHGQSHDAYDHGFDEIPGGQNSENNNSRRRRRRGARRGRRRGHN